jgi:hypothetical protein
MCSGAVDIMMQLYDQEEMSEDKEKRKRKAQTALLAILNMEKRLPENFDPKKELQEARAEKYDDFS